MNVHIVCRNYKSDRIIPRMASALQEALGWSVGARGPGGKVQAIYLSAYFEIQRIKAPPSGRLARVPVAAYFTHREENPPNNAKARLFDEVAARVDLRVATCGMYAERMAKHGPTLQASAPVDRSLFYVDGKASGGKAKPVVGVSGYTYPNRRKGQDLVLAALRSPLGSRIEWRASGRGWPVPTRRLQWRQMGAFYHSLDVLLCPSRVEGIPMPPLEALACGVPVVIPRGVGLLDELMDCEGIYRYKRGDAKDMIGALERAAFPPRKPDPEALAAVTAPYSVEAWVEDHRRAFGGIIR